MKLSLAKYEKEKGVLFLYGGKMDKRGNELCVERDCTIYLVIGGSFLQCSLLFFKHLAVQYNISTAVSLLKQYV